MYYKILKDGKEIGHLMTNQSMTDLEICDAAGLDIESEDFDLDAVDIVEE